MIDITREILDNLRSLSRSLKSSGNGGPAKFVDDLCERIIKSQDNEELQMTLKELSRLATLSQYGDFSPAEESMLYKIQRIAQNLTGETGK